MLLPALVVAIAQPPVNSLAAVLERLYWNAGARGPLLIVAPELYTPQQKPDEPPPDLFRHSRTDTSNDSEEPEEKPEPLKLPAGPLNPTVLLPLFGLQVTRLEGLSVVTHRRMQVTQPLTLTESQVDGLVSSSSMALERFLGTLDEPQWQAIGSKQGLAEAQLSSPQQKTLFRQLLPATAVAFFATEPPLPKVDPDSSDDPPALPPGALTGMRLRIEKRLSLSTFAPGAARESVGLRDQENLDPDGKLRRVVLLQPEKYVSDEASNPWTTRPARLKPTQLDPASPALDAPILLDGAKTVGELVGRIAQATRLRLLCDKRVASCAVVVKGRGSLRAGTVLAALCHGIQGAVRRLDNLYLLTSDIQTSIERSEEAARGSFQVSTTLEQRGKQARDEALLARGHLIRTRAADRVPRDSQSQAPDTLWKLGEKLPKTRPSVLDDDEAPPPDPESLPLASLPSVLQQRALTNFQKRLAASQKLGEALPKQPTQVSGRVTLYAELLLPHLDARVRIGSLPLERIHPETPLPAPPPPVTWPETPVRAWYLPLPAEEKESTALLALATQCKVTELRIALPTGEAAEKRLAELARQAKDAKLKLVPVLQPFVALSPETRRDLDLLGRTARAWSQTLLGKLQPPLDDYLEPEALDTALFTAYCLRLARLPGVTGLALTQLAPPGYGTNESWEGGGQRSERLAFLQKESLDPADLQGEDDSSAPEAQERWEKRKEARRDAALTRLHQALKAATLPVPVSAEGYAGWEQWRLGILRAPTYSDGQDLVLPPEARPVLRTLSLEGTPWRPATAWDGGASQASDILLDTTGQLRAWLQRQLNEQTKPPHYDGIVLDLSERPLADGLALLEQAFGTKAGA
ncbi:hypothetical protein [Armatimonas rosea]|uniref:Uncharacterized protein n=1 Tax=Armatimonas rosea TaxID=685828 RepID=A0A7W9SMH0_ARMRO|nr:hypothetical protein [Armatimonas rosea]MBB6048894.1 hypothetical protein [Armatimonas rosea]